MCKQHKNFPSCICWNSEVQIEVLLLINLLGFGDMKSSKGRASVFLVQSKENHLYRDQIIWATSCFSILLWARLWPTWRSVTSSVMPLVTSWMVLQNPLCKCSFSLLQSNSSSLYAATQSPGRYARTKEMFPPWVCW